MTSQTTTTVQTLATAGAVLAVGVAGFQSALALGLPLGDAVFGGRAPTVNGVLTAPFRLLAVAQALVLLAVAWLLLVRAGVVTHPAIGGGSLTMATWVLAGFLALNTVGNLAAPHPVERWIMGTITLLLTGIAVVVALRAPALA
jgi:hypothetical protein